VLEKFRPNLYIRDFQQLDLAVLKDKGIKLLLCDIDNTMVPPDQKVISSEARAFCETAKSQKIQVMFVSNNNQKRVEKFVDDSGFLGIWTALKPLSFGFAKAIKKAGVSTRETAVLGDQLLTDIYGAKRSGLLAIKSEPLVQRDLPITRLNRFFERWIQKQLDNKYPHETGVYYD